MYTKEQLAAKGYHDGKKKIYYISAEFLIGKLLSNNLINLGIYDEVAEFLKKNGKSLAKLNPLSRNHLLEMVVLDVWLHVSWILLNTWTSWRRYWSELPSWTFQTGLSRCLQSDAIRLPAAGAGG